MTGIAAEAMACVKECNQQQGQWRIACLKRCPNAETGYECPRNKDARFGYCVKWSDGGRKSGTWVVIGIVAVFLLIVGVVVGYFVLSSQRLK